MITININTDEQVTSGINVNSRDHYLLPTPFDTDYAASNNHEWQVSRPHNIDLLQELEYKVPDPLDISSISLVEAVDRVPSLIIRDDQDQLITPLSIEENLPSGVFNDVIPSPFDRSDIVIHSAPTPGAQPIDPSTSSVPPDMTKTPRKSTSKRKPKKRS